MSQVIQNLETEKNWTLNNLCLTLAKAENTSYMFATKSADCHYKLRTVCRLDSSSTQNVVLSKFPCIENSFPTRSKRNPEANGDKFEGEPGSANIKMINLKVAKLQ